MPLSTKEIQILKSWREKHKLTKRIADLFLEAYRRFKSFNHFQKDLKDAWVGLGTITQYKGKYFKPASCVVNSGYDNWFKLTDAGIPIITDLINSLPWRPLFTDLMFGGIGDQWDKETPVMTYPLYNVEEYNKVKPGLYLALFHGFHNEEERKAIDDYGVNGPMIGPLQYCHTTYACHMKLRFKTNEDAQKYGFESYDSFNEVKINKEGCVVFNGMEYGDWTVCNFPCEE